MTDKPLTVEEIDRFTACLEPESLLHRICAAARASVDQAKLVEEVERLHHDFTMADAAVKNQRETVQKWQAEVTTLRTENERLREALEVYANCRGAPGEMARAALSSSKDNSPDAIQEVGGRSGAARAALQSKGEKE
jgi:regulator of replication initiation timing